MNKNPNGKSRLKAGLIALLILLILFFVLAWFALPSFPGPEFSPEPRSLSNANQIGIACKAYAIDHDGNFPPSLDALSPYLQKRFLISPFNPADPVGYRLTPGLKDKPPYDAILIEDKFVPPVKHERIIVYADGIGRILRFAPDKLGTVDEAFKNAKYLGLCCRRYAGDHGGNYPPNLDAIVPKYLPSRAFLASPFMPSEPRGYYYRPGLRTDTESGFVLIADRFASIGQCGIIIDSDGTAQVVDSWPEPTITGT